MFAQVTFKLLQKILAGGAIFSALRGIRVNSIEIVTPDEKITCETAAVFKRIARSFRELKRFALAFRHFRRVDDGSRRFFRFCAGFFSDLFLRRFERRFHIIRLLFRGGIEDSLDIHQKARKVSTSPDMTPMELKNGY